MKNKFIFLGLCVLMSWLPVSVFASQPAPIIKNIGNGGFTADTKNSLAQTYFNQGMVFFYGFDYLESIRSFEAAVKLDKNCSRCQFGLALSLGSITNAFIQGDELNRANEILSKTNSNDAVTQGLLDALRLRYQITSQPKEPEDKKKPHCAQAEIDLPSKNKLAFSNALFALMQKFPNEQTIAALLAYSVLGTNNWELYDSLSNIRPYTNMMLTACKRILSVNPEHIGAIHYYIHGTEWSKDPAQSLEYANKLASLAPLAEHLVHMPSHIYLRLGDYNKAVTQNLKAIKAYDEYETICHKQGFNTVDNFLNQHNFEFLFVSAIFAGRADVASKAAENVRKATPLAWLDKRVGFQRFYASQFFALAHFGSWEQLKPLEKTLEKYPYITAMWAYAEALHALVLHNRDDFEVFFQKFMNASKENNANKSAKREFANNLAIAKEILLANNAREAAQWEDAILHWHNAVSKQSAGGDPPEWYFPTVLGLGYTFLDAGKPEQAILTFESSLASNPENGWALYGLAKAHRTLGHMQKAIDYESKLQQIWHPKAVHLPIQQGSDLFLAAPK